MNRVTELEVMDILPDNTKLTEVTLIPFVISANVLITDLLAGFLTDGTLKEIERWLAAHMATVSKDRLILEAGAGGATVKYAGHFGAELMSTQYGQMVLMLDTSNRLRNLKDGKRNAWTYAVPGA